MKCRVFRSERKNETYLYLAAEVNFEDLPENLQTTFGDPAFVMDLELTPGTRLARVAIEKVLNGLEADGYFLQLPPKLPVEEEITKWFA